MNKYIIFVHTLSDILFCVRHSSLQIYFIIIKFFSDSKKSILCYNIKYIYYNKLIKY